MSSFNTPGVYFKVVDSSSDTTEQVECIASAEVETIMRYYASEVSWKVMKLPEAEAISEAGMDVGVVFEDGNGLASFTEAIGYANGESAFKYAKDVIGQPADSAIYFAVDLNVTGEEIDNNVIPYFRGVKNAFEALGSGEPRYKVGAYGCGAAVNALQDAQLCEFRWLSDSTSFNGTESALENGDYDLAQQFHKGLEVCGVGIDGDELRDGVTAAGIGGFKVGG
jgi:hypothetical protein